MCKRDRQKKFTVHEWRREADGPTHSSRMKLPTEMPPQLMPPMRLPAMRLPASDSRLGRLPWSRLGFWMFMEIGFAPTKESCRLRPMAESKGPVVMVEGSAGDGLEGAGGPEDSRKSSNSRS